MGYRSDVKMVTTKEGWERIKHAVKAVNPDHTYLVDDELVVPVCNGKYMLYEINWTKWYDEYPEVDAFMRTLFLLERDNIPYNFIRVGEDWGDVEEHSNAMYDKYPDLPYLTVNQEIIVEY